jgi:hypothetical protein
MPYLYQTFVWYAMKSPSPSKAQTVLPHGRVLRITASGKTTWVTVEMPRRYKKLAWKRFKAEARAAGLGGLDHEIGVREIRDRAVANEILGITSPERLARRVRNGAS